MPSLSGLAVICVLVWFQNRGPRRKNYERCPCWKKRLGAQRIASLWALAEMRQAAHTHSPTSGFLGEAASIPAPWEAPGGAFSIQEFGVYVWGVRGGRGAEI